MTRTSARTRPALHGTPIALGRAVQTHRIPPNHPFRDQPDWLQAFRRGERQALERVYLTYVRGIEGYLRSLAATSRGQGLAHKSSVADVLQDVFLRAFSPTTRRNYDGVHDYGAYLATIAHHCFIDLLRAQSRETRETEAEWLAQLNEMVAPLDEGVDPRVQSILSRYLAELPRDLSEVYELRFKRGHSQHESSTSLRISRCTLRTRENQLRSGLRRALARGGISLHELGAAA